EVVQRYTSLTGRSAMLPKYALGYLGSSMYYSELSKDCDQAIIDFIDTAKEESVPIDGFQLSSGYCNHEGQRYFFTWNKERFKDPKGFF
ncbi:alpha-glucosidase, partial [Enterococcus faecalis]|nr:alpha-glucosidase [Enterococcus faecalis]